MELSEHEQLTERRLVKMIAYHHLLDILVIGTKGLYWFTLWMESIICRSREGSLSVSLIDQDFIIVDCFPYLGV